MSEIKFCLVRVDDRLLHGQVRLNWVRALRPRRIAIVDGECAGDELARRLLFATAMPELNIWIGGILESVSVLLQDPEGTMILMRSPDSAVALFEAGVHYTQLNLGCIGAKAGRVWVSKQVNLARTEMEALRSLVLRGVLVSIQALPSDPPRDVMELIGRRF